LKVTKRVAPSNKLYKQGYFIPENLEKYKGDATNIFYRSSWEQIFMTKYCDRNPNCLAWVSEEIEIPYYNPTDQKIHKYFVDFFCIIKDTDDNKTGIFVEIKPEAQLHPPTLKETQKTSTKRLKRYNKECIEYIRNMSKWKAAKEYAENHNCKFVIVTEKQLGLKK